MNRRSVIAEGVLVGAAGASVVALWFFVYDLLAGTPYRTPALLGAALFHGLRDPAALVVEKALVVQYTIVHGALFMAFGLAAAGLFALADRDRRVLFAAFMLFCCFEVFFLAMVAVLAERLFHAIGPWAILGGNLLASVVMIGILVKDRQLFPASGGVGGALAQGRHQH